MTAGPHVQGSGGPPGALEREATKNQTYVGERRVHAYPDELASFVRARWPHTPQGERMERAPGPPDEAVLRQLLSVCYQASLLHEEGRPVTFRLALGEPDLFRAESGPPRGLHRLTFTSERPCDEQEIRRLAPAAPFYRSMIGARANAERRLEIWGLLQSGTRWVQHIHGGRSVGQDTPLIPVVAVTGPGRLLVSRGTETVGKLSGGVLSGPSMNVFEASWLARAFARQEASEATLGAHPDLAFDPKGECALRAAISQHIVRRAVATIRSARHGGTIVVAPADVLRRMTDRAAPTMTLKYGFRDDEPRRRVATLIGLLTDRLNRLHDADLTRSLDWLGDASSTDPTVALLDEAVFEVAHLMAALADVDGAVVLTSALDLVGFGGEISGRLADVPTVARALDLEGRIRISERTDRVGTRHRSVFRLCEAFHEAMAIVISQDGGVRFVRWHDGAVTYWDQIATGPWEV